MSLASNIRAGRAYVEIVADSSKLQRGLREAQERLRAFAQTATTVGRDLMALGGSMALPFVAAVRSFASFDDAMRLAQAVTQATGRELEALTEKAQTLGRMTSFTAKQSAEAMVALGRMGFSPREIETAAGAVLDLARATGTDLAEAADFAANSLRIFRLRSSDMVRVADVLTATANGSAQTLGDLFEALKVAGPQAVAAGESLEDTNAALGVLANVGIKGSLAGTALRKSFSQFAKADVQKTLAEWGISATTAEGDLRPLADVLREVAAVMQRMPTAERISFAEAIFDLRGSLAGLSLTGDIGQLDIFIDKLRDIEGVAAKTAQKMDAGLGGSFRLLASAAEGSLNAMAGQLTVALQPLIDRVTATINATTQWVTANGSLVRSVAGAAASIALFGAATLGLGFAARGLVATFSVAQGVVGGIATALTGLASVGQGAVRTLGLITTAFRGYADASQPVLVSTSRLLVALRLPIDARANQIAASFLLMSRAETAAAARSVLAAKLNALTSVLRKVRVATLATAAAHKAHALSEGLAAFATKALAGAQALAAASVRLFSGATAKAALTSAANASANLALAASAKAVAAGYLVAGTAAKAFCALPIGAVFMAATVAVMGLYMWLSRSGKHTAKLTDEMQRLREAGDATRKTDRLRLQRLEQLASKHALSNAEMQEAERLSKTLKGRYGDLGIAIDGMSRSLTVAADAQSKLTEAMKASAIRELEAEIAEYKANIAELGREVEAQQHWSNHNLWSLMSGRHEEALNTMKTANDKQLVYMKKLSALRARIEAIENEGSDRTLTGEDEAGALDAAIATEDVQRQTAQGDVDSARKRALEIERQLRREGQSELVNEIEDIHTLRDEYTQLIRTMLDFERGKRNRDAATIADLERKLVEAETTAAHRVQAARQRHAEQAAQGVQAVKEGYSESVRATERNRDEAAFDRQLEALNKTSPDTAKGVLESLVQRLTATVESARKAYENVVAEVTGDGQVTEEEQGRADAARERYSRLESVRSRYEGRLDQARKATEAASSRQTPALGGFYAKALQNLGATQVQDKTLKAAQATAQNTKRVVELLRQQAEHGLAFT